MKKILTISAVLVALVIISIASSGVSANKEPKVELRCGWFSNPTPANAWLDDRDGQWIIGTQGGHQAEGDWPSFKDRDWVKTNGSYGYGCACMKVEVDRETSEVSRIISASSRPLAACRKDRALKEPK